MKSGNQNVAENVLAKACMFLKMKFQVEQVAGKKRMKFAHLVREALRNVKPLVELNTNSGSSASSRSRRKKPKAIPMSSRRGEKLAVE